MTGLLKPVAIFAIILVILGYSHNSLSAALSCVDFYTSKYQKTANFQQPSIDQFRKHMMGVHVTNYYPVGGVLKAAYNKGLSMRPTVHFALGQMVVSHDAGAWENSSYAVLTPFSQIEKQLLNVFHQDTFILGDLKLKKGSIILVPVGEHIEAISDLEVINYDPARITLREKIEEILTEKNQWVFKATGGNDYDKVFFKGEQLDQKDFFKSIMEEYPQVTFGLHHAHPTGKIDHFISANLQIFKDASAVTERHYFDWILQLETIKMHLSQIDIIARRFKNIPEAYQTYLSAVKRFEGKMNIINAEIELQRKESKTLLGSKNLPHDFLEHIKEVSSNKELLRNYLEKNLLLLKAVEHDFNDMKADVYTSYELADLRRGLSVSTFSNFLRLNSEIAEAAGGVEFQLGLKTVETTKSLKVKKEAFSKLLSQCNYQQCHGLLVRMLSSDMGLRSKALFLDPVISKNLSQFFDLNAFLYLRPKSEDPKGWVWFARELYRRKDSATKLKWWESGLKIYHFEQVP